MKCTRIECYASVRSKLSAEGLVERFKAAARDRKYYKDGYSGQSIALRVSVSMCVYTYMESRAEPCITTNSSILDQNKLLVRLLWGPSQIVARDRS